MVPTPLIQGQLKGILGRLDAALAQDLGALNKSAAHAGIPPASRR